MRTPEPVDVDALRTRWREITARHADRKTQRVAWKCCWDNIGRDLLRYGRVDRITWLTELLGSAAFAAELEHRLEYEGPDQAAAWLEKELGVSLDVGTPTTPD